MVTTSTSQTVIDLQPEVHGDVRSQGTATGRASQDGPRPNEVKLRVVVTEEYRELFEAARKGNWKYAEQLFKRDSEAITAKVMTVGPTTFNVLDVAIMTAQDQFVEKLVKHHWQKMGDSSLKLALTKAARRGRIKMVNVLVEKVDRFTPCNETPYDPKNMLLCDAATYASTQKEVIWYLTRRISEPDHLTLDLLIAAGYMGIPLCLLDTSFNFSKEKKMSPALNRLKISLWNLATIPAPFLKRIGESKWRNKCSLDFVDLALTEKKKMIGTTKVLELLLTSGIVLEFASRGIYEIVTLFFKHFPELIWETKFTKELMREAVKGRHEELFRLVSEPDKIRELFDKYGTKNQLIEAFIQSKPGFVSANVSGATFLMQREIQWYQVLEDMIDPSTKCYKLTSNWENFVEQRQNLLKEAGQWIKDTSSSCSVVATLIITIAFAVAFAVPGGNDSNTGIPIFLKRGPFTVFVIADVLALFSSVTATLMFLAILTSRYAMKDFIYSLPRKMVLGLTFLFLSLAFMLVAFSSALTIILSEQWKWMYIPITLLAAFPIILFAILQFPLYVEMVGSTYWTRLYCPLKLCK